MKRTPAQTFSASTSTTELPGPRSSQLKGISVGARRWLQINSVLALHAPGVSQGYAQVKRTSGNNPFIAYAVINDGGQPGERSGDGAFVAVLPERGMAGGTVELSMGRLMLSPTEFPLERVRLADECCQRSRSRGMAWERAKTLAAAAAWQESTAILSLPFTKTVAEPVWGDDEEHLVGSVAISVNSEASLLLFQAVRSQFREGGFGTVNLEETSFLARIASVFSETYLNAISSEDRRLTRRVIPRYDRGTP